MFLFCDFPPVSAAVYFLKIPESILFNFRSRLPFSRRSLPGAKNESRKHRFQLSSFYVQMSVTVPRSGIPA